MSQPDEVEITLRLLMIGDPFVGKSMLVRTYMGKPFDHFNTSTVGVDFERCTIPLGDSHIIHAYLIDTSGQERFKAITSSSYRSADCILLCFDVTNPDSFKALDFWLADIVHYSKPEVEILLVGTKIDQHQHRQIPSELAEQWKAERKLIGYIETSSALGINVDTAFHTALITAAQKYIATKSTPDTNTTKKDEHTVSITTDNNTPTAESDSYTGGYCGC